MILNENRLRKLAGLISENEENKKSDKQKRKSSSEAVKSRLQRGWLGGVKSGASRKTYKSLMKLYDRYAEDAGKGNYYTLQQLEKALETAADAHMDLDNDNVAMTDAEIADIASIFFANLPKAERAKLSTGEVLEQVKEEVRAEIKRIKPRGVLTHIPGDFKYGYDVFIEGDEAKFIALNFEFSKILRKEPYPIKRGGKLESVAVNELGHSFSAVDPATVSSNFPLTGTKAKLEQIGTEEFGDKKGKYLMYQMAAVYPGLSDQQGLQLAKMVATANGVNANNPFSGGNAELKLPNVTGMKSLSEGRRVGRKLWENIAFGNSLNEEPAGEEGEGGSATFGVEPADMSIARFSAIAGEKFTVSLSDSTVAFENISYVFPAMGPDGAVTGEMMRGLALEETEYFFRLLEERKTKLEYDYIDEGFHMFSSDDLPSLRDLEARYGIIIDQYGVDRGGDGKSNYFIPAEDTSSYEGAKLGFFVKDTEDGFSDEWLIQTMIQVGDADADADADAGANTGGKYKLQSVDVVEPTAAGGEGKYVANFDLDLPADLGTTDAVGGAVLNLPLEFDGSFIFKLSSASDPTAQFLPGATSSTEALIAAGSSSPLSLSSSSNEMYLSAPDEGKYSLTNSSIDAAKPASFVITYKKIDSGASSSGGGTGTGTGASTGGVTTQPVQFQDNETMLNTLDGLLNESTRKRIIRKRNSITDRDISVLREAAKRTLTNLWEE